MGLKYTNEDYIDFRSCVYWSDITKVNYLQRRVIVHSIIYYEDNFNVITDHDFDLLSKQLVRYQNEIDPEDFTKTKYFYCMYDFDGTTGFHLPQRLNDVDKEFLFGLVENIIKNYRNAPFKKRVERSATHRR